MLVRDDRDATIIGVVIRVGISIVATAGMALLAGTASAGQPTTTSPPWLRGAEIIVPGNPDNQDCRKGVCRHNENTDLTHWKGAIYFVHRTAGSQVLGPNSSIRVYWSKDDGKSFQLQAIIPAPPDRDIRDPAFYKVGDKLFIKAITRLPGFALRDQGAGSISIETHSKDGKSWSALRDIGPEGWGFWRVAKQSGTYYSGAYEDGDLQIVLYRSKNGKKWTEGPQIYGVSEDTPLESELVFTPNRKRMLAFFRLDGNDFELFGNQGRLRTGVCWAKKPYDSFECPQVLNGVRLDGPKAFWWKGRLFVVARKHIPGPDFRKRTALYEITGNLNRGPLDVVEWGEFPSAGDTSYAGVTRIGGPRFLVTWYSSPPEEDPSWLEGFGGRTDIWKAKLDMSRLPNRP